MNQIAALYRPSLALLTDLYPLTMAYAYWKTGMRDREAVCNLRLPPFQDSVRHGFDPQGI